MQKKSTTYFLVVMLISVWGIIAYKIFSGTSGKNTAVTNSIQYKTFDFKHKQDTFSIVANYRDPFLGTLPKRKKYKNKRFHTPQKTPVIWPDITYNGALFPKKAEASFLIDINRKGYLLKRNQSRENVKLIKGNKNYIIVRYKGELKKIEKQRQ